MAKKDYSDLASSIVDLVGGKENITTCYHCVTRLRLNLKDDGLANLEEIKKLDVLGARFTGDQLQIIIGDGIDDVYAAVCKAANIEAQKPIDENLDESLTAKKRFTFKSIGDKILGYISPIMLGIIPVMLGATLCKTIGVVLGPSVLKVISDTSDLYILLDFLGNTFFYFLPIYLGYLAAKQLKTDVLLGIYLGALIIVPQFVGMVGVRETFSVFGLQVPVANYSQTFLPVIFGVWIMSYVHKYLKKVIPFAVSAIFVPTLTILIMTFLMFAVFAPLGTYVGNVIGNLFIMLAGANIVFRLIGYIALGILFPYIVLGGMHMVLINFAIMSFLSNGLESFVLPVSAGYSFAIYGVALGATLKMKKKENKAIASSFVISGLLAGISEPILYGIILKYKRAARALMIACAIGGAYCGIFLPKVYVLSGFMNIFTLFPMWVGGGTQNTVSGIIMVVLSFVAGIAAAYFMVDYNEELVAQ